MKRTEKNRYDDGLYCIEGTILKFAGLYIQAAVTRTGACREGIAYKTQPLDEMKYRYQLAYKTEEALMNVIEQLNGNYEELAALWETYNVKLKLFRSDVRNDVASLEAAARKTTEAVTRMSKAYGDVIAQMNGHEMCQAVENAERLATAMATLAGLQSHNLAVVVANNGPSPT